MKRLVGLPLDPRLEDKIFRLLVQAGIPYRETRSPSRFLGGDAIWVNDEDYAQASALVEGEANTFAAMVRADWNAEWDTVHKGSYALWMWNRLRRASVATLVRVILLIAVVSVMLLYPLAYVLKQAI